MKRIAQLGTLKRIASTRLPTRRGAFELIGFERSWQDGRVDVAIAIVLGDLEGSRPPLLRVHSQCFTGEVLGSLRCDCGEQFEMAMRAISDEGRGLVIYECQEGRGIGLLAKLKAYALQDAGLDTIEANLALGFEADCRDFHLPAAILRHLGVRRVRLLSNNPDKHRALLDAGIEVNSVLRCEAKPTRHSLAYLSAKREKMGHTLSLGRRDPATWAVQL